MGRERCVYIYTDASRRGITLFISKYCSTGRVPQAGVTGSVARRWPIINDDAVVGLQVRWPTENGEKLATLMLILGTTSFGSLVVSRPDAWKISRLG